MTPSRPARPLTPIGIRWCLVFAVILGGFSASADTALAEKLRRHLETLAAERGFRVEGADLIGDEQGSSRKSDGLAERINQLLANYNFIVTRDTRNRIVQLTIVGLRAPPPASPPETKFIRTEKHQSEHYVEAVLAGPNGRPLPLKFMVDTGASTLVLPQSLAAPLGYAKNQLKSVDVQTANGRTMGLSAMLDSVRVGEAESARVAVTFVDDRLLGGKQLLGMSFLSRFRMTIDASNGLLHLEKQGD
jgi:aspartyl protease family protein